jgi:SpoVK/Ycf46/Vps4 family AAA+-type ATPase
MFLTTNRKDAIDDAFRSRMDLILYYPDLDEEARRQVWENFLGKLPEGGHTVSSEEIIQLAKESMNGREIKNLMKTAHVLALRDANGVLGFKHLNVVLGIRKRGGE